MRTNKKPFEILEKKNAKKLTPLEVAIENDQDS